MEEILHYENITFRREGREILKGVDWHINKGENWALKILLLHFLVYLVLENPLFWE